MPEHVHLMVYPTAIPPLVDRFLYALKRPFSYRVKQQLEATDRELLAKLTVRERPGKAVFRYWQEGPGYDRNFFEETATLTAIDYIHLNPVRRGLVERASDWKWSSAPWYESNKAIIDPDLPTIDGLPWEFFT